MQLGERIRARRKELNLSLRELAEAVGLTSSFLSLIERDQSSPSIESLRKISEALDVPVFYFLLEPYEKSPVVRHSQQLTLKDEHSNQVYKLLTPSLYHKMEALLYEQEPTGENFATPLKQHTEEFLYVLQGELELQLGDDVYHLTAGDTAYFDSPMLQRMAAIGDEILRVIAVITPPIL